MDVSLAQGVLRGEVGTADLDGVMADNSRSPTRRGRGPEPCHFADGAEDDAAFELGLRNGIKLSAAFTMDLS